MLVEPWNGGYGADSGPSEATLVGALTAQLKRSRSRSATSALRRIRPSAAQANAVSADGRPRKTLNAADFGAQSATERDHVFFVEERSDPFLRDSPLKFREGFVVARKIGRHENGAERREAHDSHHPGRASRI